MGRRIWLLPTHACESFVPQDFHGQEAYRSARGQDCGGDRDSHGHGSDPHTVEKTWMERHIRNGIHLGLKRNQMVIPGQERKQVTGEQANQRALRSAANSLPQESRANLLAAW